MSSYQSHNSMQPLSQGPPSVMSQSDFMEIPMMPMDKNQQTMMWQQNQYMTDSGIHSALGTNTPSVCSKQGPDEMDQDDGLLACTQQQPWSNGPMSVFQPDMCLMSPGTPGMANIMAGEAMADGCTPLMPPRTASSMPAGSTCSNPMADIDAEVAASAIPDLVKLIKDEDDPVVLNQASMMVFQLSKSDAIEALIEANDMLNCIISALGRSENSETIRFLSGTVYNMSQCKKGLNAIFAAGSVPMLVKLLSSAVESVLFYSITTLHNLLLHQDGAKVVIRESGCLQKMVELLQKNNIKFLAICTDCLQILGYGHQESKLAILASGGPTELVRILRTYQYEKLLWTTTRVLKVLSVCQNNKPAIIDAGGMEALSLHLQHPSTRLVHNCLWTLRNMSDAATKLDNLQGLLQALVQLLNSADTTTVTCAAGILSNLTCNNQKNKLMVCKFGGIECLLRTIANAEDREDILEPCVCALRHLTSRHEEADAAQNSVRLHSGIPVVARVLHIACEASGGPSWGLIKAVVGLVRNLALCPGNHPPMVERGLVNSLAAILGRTQQEINKAPQGTSGKGTVIQGVRMEEVLEASCAALHMLSRETSARILLSRTWLPVLVHLLSASCETIQRAATGIFLEVSQEREGLEAIQRTPGAPAKLGELVQSRREAVASYATSVVFRLTGDKQRVLPLAQPCQAMPSTSTGSLSELLGPPPPLQQYQQQQYFNQAPDGHRQQQQFHHPHQQHFVQNQAYPQQMQQAHYMHPQGHPVQFQRGHQMPMQGHHNMRQQPIPMQNQMEQPALQLMQQQSGDPMQQQVQHEDFLSDLADLNLCWPQALNDTGLTGQDQPFLSQLGPGDQFSGGPSMDTSGYASPVDCQQNAPTEIINTDFLNALNDDMDDIADWFNSSLL